jgi:hypothetical protein
MLSGNRTLTLWLIGAALLLPQPAIVLAQSVQKPPAAEGAAKKDPNVAIKALDAGSKAYSSGKLDAAVDSLTTALANGGLPPPKMAQAYYYRGLTYKKQKKPAQALSDLTVAVWVKGGLNDADRAAAMDARNQVYREAGLGDQAPPVANAVAPSAPQSAPASAPATAAAPAPAAPVAAAPPPPATGPAPGPVASPPPSPAPAMDVAATPPPPSAPPAASTPAERPVWQAEANSAPPPTMPLPADAPAAQPASPAPVVAAAPPPTSAAQVNDAYQPPPPAPAAVASAAEPAPAQQSSGSDMMAPLASAGSSISGFFSNMFGQGSGQQASAPPPQTTGSTESGYGWVPADTGARPQGPTAQVSASEPQRAPGWEAAAVQPRAAHVGGTTAEAPAPVVQHATAARSAGGKYRLQLASVRSREEADRLVQTVMSQHAAQLGGAEAEVDETVIGNMGTFYRVRVGPYANANEPKKLCTTLRPQGFDCQVVTQ